MIAASPAVAYIQEPFNLRHDLGICGARFPHWFTYVCAQNEGLYYKYIKSTIEFRYNLLTKLKTVRSRSSARRALSDWLTFSQYRLSGKRPLLKDPIAVFSADWLASKFDMDVVVLIRHPAAFVASLKVKEWRHPFSHFLEQPLLMSDLLGPFTADIEKFATHEHDIVDQGAFLWNLIHHTIRRYQTSEVHRNWSFVRHEDLSMDPLNEFHALYHRLGLEFSAEVAGIVQNYSSGGSSKLARNSRENIWTWKNRLSVDEIERVRIRVSPISKHFYSNNDW